MTDYEIYSYEAFRKHVHDDERIVERANMELEGIKKEVVQGNMEVGADNLLEFCKVPRTRKEIAQFLGIDTIFYVSKKYINPLVAEGKLEMTIPEKTSSRKQKFVIKQQYI